jgi:hypothetical protein
LGFCEDALFDLVRHQSAEAVYQMDCRQALTPELSRYRSAKRGGIWVSKSSAPLLERTHQLMALTHRSLLSICATLRWVTGINMFIAGNATTLYTIMDFIQLFRKNTLSDSTAIQVLIPATAKVIRNVRISGITNLP